MVREQLLTRDGEVNTVDTKDTFQPERETWGSSFNQAPPRRTVSTKYSEDADEPVTPSIQPQAVEPTPEPQPEPQEEKIQWG
eukprot:CAMPEP_0168539030 /NCGR_PEP_ID=MMETSP0405-20121227/21571_1 /TAXON_ID=498012 /ORGANISM="Trichosphaerium sp, Strain Am-I-7 wt" /LENGTH=81 /DNA_ID=CAMNT_0008568487 /DNA_START=371 /DNA_END=613 /DNA_ORIENTATION=+